MLLFGFFLSVKSLIEGEMKGFQSETVYFIQC